MEQTPLRSPELGATVVPTQEQGPTPESGREQPAISAEQTGAERMPVVTPVVPIEPVVPVTSTSTDVHQAIESILSEGLQVEYEQLDPTTQQRFREVGESTASQIEVLLQSTIIQIQKIITLIVTWLKILPGVNTFFLQQEAKIKADKILKLRQ